MALVKPERIAAVREFTLKVGDFEFICRYPDAMTRYEWRGLDRTTLVREIVTTCVVGWRGVREVDLVPGGGTEEAEFFLPTFQAWIRTRPDLWGPIVDEVTKRIEQADAQFEASRKN